MNAQEFFQARAQHLPIEALPSANGFDLDAAYTMESEVRRMHEAAGHHTVGRKVGYANRAMWRMLKLETLVWAHMFEDTLVEAHQGAAEFHVSSLRAPKIEPEIVVKVRDPDAGDGLAMAEWIALGFEIIDCPYPDWKVTPVDFVAAWGLHAGLIVGAPLQVTPANRDTLTNQLAEFKVVLSRNNELVEEGSGKNSLKSPAMCLTELAKASAKRGEPIQPGEIISTGTLTSGSPIAPGEEWRAELNGLPLASLRVLFN